MESLNFHVLTVQTLKLLSLLAGKVTVQKKFTTEIIYRFLTTTRQQGDIQNSVSHMHMSAESSLADKLC